MKYLARLNSQEVPDFEQMASSLQNNSPPVEQILHSAEVSQARCQQMPNLESSLSQPRRQQMPNLEYSSRHAHSPR